MGHGTVLTIAPGPSSPEGAVVLTVGVKVAVALIVEFETGVADRVRD